MWVPDESHEAMRDLVRARAAAVESLRVHRQQVGAFMLKHGRVFPRPKTWSMRYLRWLQVKRTLPSKRESQWGAPAATGRSGVEMSVAGSIGKVTKTEKVMPFSGALSTRIAPPIASTVRLAIARPIPMPR